MNFTIAGTLFAPTALMICGPPWRLSLQAGEVADEVAGLVLGEDDAGRVLRLLREERVRLRRCPTNFRFGNRGATALTAV